MGFYLATNETESLLLTFPDRCGRFGLNQGVCSPKESLPKHTVSFIFSRTILGNKKFQKNCCILQLISAFHTLIHGIVDVVYTSSRRGAGKLSRLS